MREVMSGTLYTVSPSSTVGEAVALMAQHRVGSMIVMDGTRLAGAVGVDIRSAERVHSSN